MTKIIINGIAERALTLHELEKFWDKKQLMCELWFPGVQLQTYLISSTDPTIDGIRGSFK